MRKYLLKRIFYLFLTLFIVATVTFFLMKLMPGTPLQNEAKLTASEKASILAQYGLDKPVWLQYFIYIGGIFKGSLGLSFQFSDQAVSYLIGSRMGPSMQLGGQALLVGVVLGIILGAIGAIRKDTWADRLATILSILGIAVPSFVLAILLQYYLGLKVQLFPVAGWSGFTYTILPTLALAASPLAETARFIRTDMVDVLSSDYIELAKAKGLSKFGIVYHHALRNSLIPMVTLIGPLAAALMTGSMVVENIFSVPGIGEQFVKSILVNDYPTIMGVTIFYSALLCLLLLLTDIVYGIIDPRIRLSGNGD
ncbi:oligopeptide ABC transporter permease [Lactiplantibacillus mudanjiangensis]|uniref:Oligopeptide ABC transporter, permease protein [Lactobacillus plantarum JDM1] n=1 Tax=Lactiplantibacillus mudanjiangensis TaxID=1296538 RepID=A0A660DVR9_9LACO|nr:oligopeptide ABC transporter permease [Lactiplantibacillus mudanjiangensis]VDG17519.1 oligopeptide ABC transporter, permease protein [Lactobacillus plantarum JDM1] [Lactiplantibacillus mudanjiangensis]VDG24697.1 oligopeptide ABC transporter, permease protein [Lactobacillus plantarum JDM1] [Lactiplantibacillus mudanjiangensis]VDG27722.1 oligopeptide ABC transporter, permease protein [Lactobacillus plantarum JDM1] [Lactiplantibacillus mudanjiangensis]VDG32801.1 oligopeptide ABC transporter, pe